MRAEMMTRSSPRNAKTPRAFIALPDREPMPGIVLPVPVDVSRDREEDEENASSEASRLSRSDLNAGSPLEGGPSGSIIMGTKVGCLQFGTGEYHIGSTFELY